MASSLSLQPQSPDDNDIKSTVTVPVVELHAAVTEGNLTKLESILDRYGVDLVSEYHLLHTAASCGQVATVKLLITKYNWPVDCKNENEQTPLHLACGSGDLDVIQVLIMEYKADLNVRDKQNDTPLHIAARHGRIEVIKCLIDVFNCNPSTIGYEGRTILHYACYEGHTELVEELMKQYVMDPLSNDDSGNNSLHYAVRGGREKIVKALTANYSNLHMAIECRNKNGESAFDVACSSGHLNIARLFIVKYGLKQPQGDNLLRVAVRYGQTDTVSCLIDKFGYDPNTKGRDNMTILWFAYHEEQLKVVEMLITRYELRIISNGDINTLLHYMVSKGKANVAKLILMKLNGLVDSQNENKESPLHIACIAGHITIIKILVTEHGADLNARDIANNTPLHKAAIHGQTAVINVLIKDFGCDPISKGYNGATALHYACREGHAALMETLLSLYQLDPMTTDDDGSTPLHYAALGGRDTVVKQLISKYSCPVDCTNKNNVTPLHLACGHGHLNVVQTLILVYEADLNVCNEDNDTPLHTAALCGQLHIINYIILNRLGYISSTHLQRNKESYIMLLHHACRQGHMEIIESLLTYSKLDPLSIDDDGNTLVHLAAMGGSKTVVKMLVTKYGCPVNSKNNTGQSPLHLACTSSHTQVITTLLSECKADLFVRDNIMNYTPLHRAVHRGQIDIMKCLIDSFGIDVTRTDGSNLLHFACQEGLVEAVMYIMTQYTLRKKVTREIVKISDHYGNTPLHYSAFGGQIEVATLLISVYGAPVNHQNNKNETPLHLACTKGHVTFIQVFVKAYKPDMNTCDINKQIPLQRAALSGQTYVVQCLNSDFHCDLKIIGARGRNLLHYACLNDHDKLARTLITTYNFSLIAADIDGNSPLHISAMLGKNKCVIMLLSDFHAPIYLRNNSGRSALEVTRNVITKDIIETYLREEHNRIQYDYKEIQILSSKKFSGAQKLTRVFVIGNVGSGKSTLIESLKRQGFFSSLNQVSEATVPPHTNGIIPSEYQDKSIGRVLYYDFAGNPEYYSSHSAIMSSIMQAKEGTNVYLVLINLKKDDKDIHEELGYWLSFISFHCKNLIEKCKVLIISSHVDLISKHEASRKVALISKFTENFISKSSIEIVKSENDLAINCRQPRSSTHVHSTLNQILSRAATCDLSKEAAVLLGLLEKDFKNVVTCKVQTLLTHIVQTEVCLPKIASSLHPIIMELHTIGLLLIIESISSNLEDYLLILNVSKLTNEVHKLLFSKDSGQKFLSFTDPHSASMGILPQTYLTSILPEYVTTECLIQLQYCQEFSHAEVKLDYSVITTKDFCAPRLLYFPALCGIERRKKIRTPQFYDYSVGWYVKCCGKFDYLPPRFLHVLLLRLAHTYALPAAYEQPSNPSTKGNDATTLQLYNRRCTMWKNGIHWLMEEGVECFVEMVNNSKGVVIVAKSEEARKLFCTDILFKIIQEIRQAKEEFCETVTLQEYFMDSADPASFINENMLFHSNNIAKVLNDGKPYIISADKQGSNQLSAAIVSHLRKYIHWGEYCLI